MSSAYWTWLTPKPEIKFAIGETYSENSNGPGTDPCGTPKQHAVVLDFSSPTRTNCEQPLMYDRSQESVVLVKPKVCSSLLPNVLMSMQSNAADRSNSTSSDLDPSSAALYTSLSSRSNAVSVECPRLYADWARLKFGDCSTCSIIFCESLPF